MAKSSYADRFAQLVANDQDYLNWCYARSVNPALASSKAAYTLATKDD